MFPEMARPFPPVEGVEHRYVDAKGLRMHVPEAGPRDGEPLVMLHGWPQHWYEFRHQIPPLAERYRVIAPDLRGLGWTDAPPDGYDKENMGTDVLNLLDVLGLERVLLVGHDWGGWIGFLICLRAPERFRRFVALNIPTPFARRDPLVFANIWRFWYMAAIATPGLGPRLVAQTDLVGRMLRSTKRPNAITPEEIREFSEPLREPDRTRATVAIYRTFITREFGRVATEAYNKQRLTVPTRLLFGQDDFAIPKRMLTGDFSKYADHLEIEFVPNCGHFIEEEQPELVTERILDFFGAADRAAVG
jgi:pimeloyl-ACP methyl ester carboxylesterase